MHARRIICGLVTSECPLLLPGLSFHVHLCGKQTLTFTRFDSIHSGMVSAFGRKLWRGTRSTAVTFSEQNQCWISSLQTIQSGNLLHLVLTFKAVWNGAWVGARWGEWRSWTWRWETLRCTGDTGRPRTRRVTHSGSVEFFEPPLFWGFYSIASFRLAVLLF